MTPHLFAYQVVPQTESATSVSGAPTSAPSGAPDSGATGSSLFMFLLFVPVILLLFWQTRSQQKKQEQAVAGLKKGDRVVTQSGLIGRLLELDQRTARLELAPGVKVSVLRSSLAGRDAEDSTKVTSSDAPDKKADKANDKDTK